jgi:hypothetical protein
MLPRQSGSWIGVTAHCDRGTVYVLGLGPYVKIGFTAVGIEKRVKYLKIGMPETPRVLGAPNGTPADEMALHKHFAGYRLSGEWFRNEGAVAEWIGKGCSLSVLSHPVPPSIGCALEINDLVVGGDGLEPPTLSV